MGAALSFLGQKLFASSTLISARCENISCCTSVAAVHPPIIRRTGGFLKKRMTTIYVDSRKRVAGSDSDFEVDLGESLHLQSDVRLAVYKIRLADSFLSTDRGRYLYWVDAALGTLNWALLPEGAHTGARLAAWISSNFATATYGETTNSLSVASDGNRLILNDLELRQQFPDAADYPSAPAHRLAPHAELSHLLGGDAKASPVVAQHGVEVRAHLLHAQLQQLGQLPGHAERLVLKGALQHVLLAEQLEAHAPQAPHALAQERLHLGPGVPVALWVLTTQCPSGSRK